MCAVLDQGRKSAIKMPAGQHTYEFAVELPGDLPTTLFRSDLLKASYK